MLLWVKYSLEFCRFSICRVYSCPNRYLMSFVHANPLMLIVATVPAADCTYGSFVSGASYLIYVKTWQELHSQVLDHFSSQNHCFFSKTTFTNTEEKNRINNTGCDEIRKFLLRMFEKKYILEIDIDVVARSPTSQGSIQHVMSPLEYH